MTSASYTKQADSCICHGTGVALLTSAARCSAPDLPCCWPPPSHTSRTARASAAEASSTRCGTAAAQPQGFCPPPRADMAYAGAGLNGASKGTPAARVEGQGAHQHAEPSTCTAHQRQEISVMQCAHPAQAAWQRPLRSRQRMRRCPWRTAAQSHVSTLHRASQHEQFSWTPFRRTA